MCLIVWGFFRNLPSGKLPGISVFALIVLLTGQFLEVPGLLLPWFKELNWTVAKKDFHYSLSRCRINEWPFEGLKDFGDAMLFLSESVVPSGVATGCILCVIAAMERRCYYCEDGVCQFTSPPPQEAKYKGVWKSMWCQVCNVSLRKHFSILSYN